MLANIKHIVVLMLENRSFDQMLGFLYPGNVSSAGDPFEGLTGNETNADASGKAVRVFPLTPTTKAGYFMPGADPGEGFQATNIQLFSASSPANTAPATCAGFVVNYASALASDTRDGKDWTPLPGTTASDIMGIFTPAMLPVLSGLARGYAVCDHWFSSLPTMTLPNRAFACAATSQGHMDDKSHSFTVKSIFGLLTASHVTWAGYGYNEEPLFRGNFPDTLSAPDANFGKFADFQKAAAAGSLASYVFLEPEWSSTGNSQHPNYDVALGEQLIHDVYYALRNGPDWNETLLVITYDEHGGNYDHVPPPTGATPPDATPGEFGFDFTRFGVRVPAVLVSPLIAAGTVFRVPAGSTPIDHTSILKTVETRWDLAPLTARDRAAPDLGGVLTLATARTDDPLGGVVVPVSGRSNVHKVTDPPSHLQLVHADLVSRLPVPNDSGSFEHKVPQLATSRDCDAYIHDRITRWKASRHKSGASGKR
jgi:phospholipase C